MAFFDEPQIPGRTKQSQLTKMTKTILFVVEQGIQFRREKEMLDTQIFTFDPEDPDADPNTDMTRILSKGLKLMEDQMIVEEKADQERIQRRLQNWRADIQRAVSENHEFEGIPINFSFSDAKRIKNRICDRFEEWVLEEDESDEPFTFVFGAACAPYHCAVNSTWVYACKIRPVEPEEE